MPEPAELFARVPDFCDGERFEPWLSASLSALGRIVRPPDGAPCVAVDGAALGPAPGGALGWFGSPAWRRLVGATLLADWASYPLPAHRVSFERLAFVMNAFPEGFRIFWLDCPGEGFLPVGYSGFYPIAPATFERLEGADGGLADRRIWPLTPAPPRGQYMYLFSYSIVDPLRRSPWSRRLVRALAEDVGERAPAGLAALTVSADGRRVAERFGLRQTGVVHHAGSEEWVYTGRFPGSQLVPGEG
jgi:hypothetical protein